jgi:type I restriction enzyme S subunit
MTYQVDEDVTDVRYLYYYFTSERGLATVRAASPGSAGRNRTLGIKAFDAQKIELPDLDEQRRIIVKLDKGIVEREALVSRSRQLRAALKPSLLNAAFSAPKLHSAHGVASWAGDRATSRTVRIGDVLELCRETVQIDPSGIYRSIGVKSFGNGLITYPPCPGAELSKLRYFVFPPNALALSNIKAWEGAVAVTDEHHGAYVASNRFLFYLPLRPDEIDVRYLYYYFTSERGLNDLGKASPGSADRNRTLSIKSFERLTIQLPEIEEQRGIVATLDRGFVELERLTERRWQPEAALRPSLLNAAFSGRL